jgi:hypothetical protein
MHPPTPEISGLCIGKPAVRVIEKLLYDCADYVLHSIVLVVHMVCP